MAHSSFAKTLSEVSKSDGSLSRTLLECSNSGSSSSCLTASVLLTKMRKNQKTPSRTPRRPVTPGGGGSDLRKTPGQLSKTPNLMNSKSSLENEGDRFIPNRSATDISRAQHAIREMVPGPGDENVEYERAISESLRVATIGKDTGESRILRFKSDVRKATNANLCPTPPPVVKPSSRRVIPKVPEKVLDAPEIVDDFYLNILSWSMENVLAIALNNEVYLWNATSGDIACLMSTGYETERVTSVCWSPDAPGVIAIGLTAGRVQLWNATTQSLIRTMDLGDISSACRVPVVTWRDHIVTSGSRSGHIRHHDTRIAHHEVGVNDFHTQEVCGLAWSPDKRFLASGANDNVVAIWSSSTVSESTDVRPQTTLSEHQAAVKALAWCPWKPNLLCTGGGTADHTLRFWNAATGNCAKSVDVTTQVSGIIWNSEYREILTAHGGPKNDLAIWKYPDINQVAELMEHQGRVLCVASSPNNEMVASCAADETLRIWHCFAVDHTKKRVLEKTQRASVYTRTFR
ncbi:unnamed protein product [Calicophoron daubneyi]|uniref:CDC20/Fizzy WD40 domain-containing protein n=1 Tax=Calicophoron daubneyi TaxID=300641 RepID=A0AAV2T4V8_CALDB